MSAGYRLVGSILVRHKRLADKLGHNRYFGHSGSAPSSDLRDSSRATMGSYRLRPGVWRKRDFERRKAPASGREPSSLLPLYILSDTWPPEDMGQKC
ncbi:hypothetical protein E4U13_005501 [Claviceps humidiphila]|uniref:Uncharacterized protein n=1 Tax=Claviceps humidiphila TaxID=1294629 RepID=A0A9P7TXH5_9HYPO|nr:hypothetical protein E4U13_005501 [Claviceps humidiphila]